MPVSFTESLNAIYHRKGIWGWIVFPTFMFQVKCIWDHLKMWPWTFVNKEMTCRKNHLLFLIKKFTIYQLRPFLSSCRKSINVIRKLMTEKCAFLQYSIWKKLNNIKYIIKWCTFAINHKMIFVAKQVFTINKMEEHCEIFWQIALFYLKFTDNYVHLS